MPTLQLNCEKIGWQAISALQKASEKRVTYST